MIPRYYITSIQSVTCFTPFLLIYLKYKVLPFYLSTFIEKKANPSYFCRRIIVLQNSHRHIYLYPMENITVIFLSLVDAFLLNAVSAVIPILIYQGRIIE